MQHDDSRSTINVTLHPQSMGQSGGSASAMACTTGYCMYSYDFGIQNSYMEMQNMKIGCVHNSWDYQIF